MDLANCGLKRDMGLMQQYNDLGCGKDIPLENCLYYNYKFKQNPNDKSWEVKMKNANCKEILASNTQKTIEDIYGTYSDLDKQRIEAESKFQRNQKVFFGGMVFLLVVGIFLIKKK